MKAGQKHLALSPTALAELENKASRQSFILPWCIAFEPRSEVGNSGPSAASKEALDLDSNTSAARRSGQEPGDGLRFAPAAGLPCLDHRGAQWEPWDCGELTGIGRREAQGRATCPVIPSRQSALPRHMAFGNLPGGCRAAGGTTVGRQGDPSTTSLPG